MNPKVIPGQEKGFPDLKEALPPIERVLMYGTAAILLFAFTILFIANPGVTGLSVVDASAGQGRFSGTSSILLVIFAMFAFFIFVVTKKLRASRNQGGN